MANCKEKEETFGLEDENGEELEREKEGIRVVETEETAIDFEASSVCYLLVKRRRR